MIVDTGICTGFRKQNRFFFNVRMEEVFGIEYILMRRIDGSMSHIWAAIPVYDWDGSGSECDHKRRP